MIPMHGTPTETTRLDVAVDAQGGTLVLVIQRGPLRVTCPIGANPTTLVEALRTAERALTGAQITLVDARGAVT